MNNEIAKYEDVGVLDAKIIEEVVIKNNLSVLNANQRLEYYNHVCKVCKLDPAMKPFDYIKLQGKETLYANKTCAAQLRRIYGVSVTDCDTQVNNGFVITKVTVRDHKGRVDSDVGVVPHGGGSGLDNAIMKSVTKAKRRATLSICGLGMLDETEIATAGSWNNPENENKCKSSILFSDEKEHEPEKPKTPPAKTKMPQGNQGDSANKLFDAYIKHHEGNVRDGLCISREKFDSLVEGCKVPENNEEAMRWVIDNIPVHKTLNKVA
jgi:hypothetical protein